jgi:hypothetical protein
MLLLSGSDQNCEPLPLILPGSLEWLFSLELLGPPPGWLEEIHRLSGEVAFVARPGGCGLLEAVSLEAFAEHWEDGGEGEARQLELEQEWAWDGD